MEIFEKVQAEEENLRFEEVEEEVLRDTEEISSQYLNEFGFTELPSEFVAKSVNWLVEKKLISNEGIQVSSQS